MIKREKVNKLCHGFNLYFSKFKLKPWQVLRVCLLSLSQLQRGTHSAKSHVPSSSFPSSLRLYSNLSFWGTKGSARRWSWLNMNRRLHCIFSASSWHCSNGLLGAFLQRLNLFFFKLLLDSWQNCRNVFNCRDWCKFSSWNYNITSSSWNLPWNLTVFQTFRFSV